LHQSRTKGVVLDTYTIITTDPNKPINDLSIHDRMPVILKHPIMADGSNLGIPADHLLTCYDVRLGFDESVEGWP
jgi:hypothetical protein